MAPSEPFAQVARDVAWLAPLEAYRRLRAAGLKPALLHGAGAHPDARWSIVAFEPVVEVRLDEGSVEERWASGAVDAGPADALAALRDLERRSTRLEREEAPFTGGWVGHLAFSFARAVEPGLPARRGPGPDAVLRLHLGAVAFDHLHATAHLFAADLDGDDAAAHALADRAADALSATAPPPATACSVLSPWEASLDAESFGRNVARLRDLVHDGDHFQANLATRFSARIRADPADLLEHLVANNPSPYMALLETDGQAIVSASPELLFARSQDVLRSRPIAGTRRRGRDLAEDALREAELRNDPKEQAEHTMLVDLVRNDVARVAVPGTVHVPEHASVERYRHVMHLVSEVQGRLRPGATFADCVAALFPGGTVTGAPKVRAVERILESEPVPRGAYTGSAGYLSWSGNAVWNILIRTFVLEAGAEPGIWNASVHAGSGIVADSDPRREWGEAQAKAQALLDAATATQGGPRPGRLGDVTRAAAWRPRPAATRHPHARVLLVDNYDSFVHNLADQFAALGAAVRVVRNDADWERALKEHRATHVVVSPGPGWPREAGQSLEVVRAVHGRLPLLGVCLGHQAIGEAFGGRVVRHPAGPVHGKPDAIHHQGAGLFAGLPSPLQGGRYHSLVVEAAPGPEWIVDATLADGTIMALRHRTHPTVGLQFHPESLCTPPGLELIDRFTALRAGPGAWEGRGPAVALPGTP